MGYVGPFPLPVSAGGTGDNTITHNAVLIGETTSAIGSTNVGTNGQVLLGATSAAPAFATLTSTGGTITYTLGANSLNLETAGTLPTVFHTGSGNAVPSAGAITMAGGNNISTSGSGSTVTYSVSGTTTHAVQIGNASGSLTSLGVGTNGQVLLGATTADPSWVTPTAGTGLSITSNATTLQYALSTPVSIANGGTNATSMATTDGTVIFDGTRLVTTATGSSGQVLTSNGPGVAPTYQAVSASGAVTSVTGGNNITITGTATAPVVNVSGTTNHAVQLGNSSGALNSLTVGTNGQLMIAATSADPSWVTPTAGTGLSVTTNASTLSYALSTPVSVSNGGTGASSFTAHSLLVGEGTSAFTALGAATNGQIPIGSTGADPVLATITAGANITVTNGAGSITIASTGGGGGTTWNEITGTSSSMAVNNGYIANNASLVTLTLPATAAQGSIIEVTGKGAGGWTIAQNSGQTIFFGTSTTTTGAGGSLSSTQRRDSVRLVCVTANNDFNVLSAQGNLTVV